MDANMLHVVTVVANPVRWKSRMQLFDVFLRGMREAGVKLTVVECQYGERPFELGGVPGINHVGVRAKTLLWNKECLINLGVRDMARNFPDWRYVAWCDGDIRFRRPDWAVETLHALQQYEVVQPWVDAYDLGPNDEHMQAHKSFCHEWWTHGTRSVCPRGPMWWKFAGGPYDYPHSGYAWAATRHAYEWLGGLFELAVMGSGDHHMAYAMIGRAEYSVPGLPGTKSGVTLSYWKHLKRWQDRAVHHVNFNIGFVPGTIEHYFHGRKSDRKYMDRWQMMIEHQFDPDTDIKPNAWGVLELAGNKPGLRHDLDTYFRLRNEDVNSLQ